MSNDERNGIIEQLVLIEGVNKSVFINMTDEQLLKQLGKHYD